MLGGRQPKQNSVIMSITGNGFHIYDIKLSFIITGLSPGSSPGRGDYVVFLGKTLTLTVPLSTQVYKWVPANIMLGVTLR